MHFLRCAVVVLAPAAVSPARAALMGVGPRIAKDTINVVYLDPFPEYQDIELKGV